MRHRPLILLAVPLTLLFAAFAFPRKPKPEPGPPARFLLPAGSQLIVGGARVPIDAIVLQGTSVGIDSGCALAAGKGPPTKKGTRVTGKWTTCGDRQKVRLRALIAPGCDSMAGTLREKKRKPARFTATRSVCGDRIVDLGNGEQCEPPGGAACDSNCRSVPPDTTTSTTTPTPTVTTTTLPGPLCGNGAANACGSIAGQVVNVATKTPLAGVAVSASSGRAASSGDYGSDECDGRA